MASCVGKKDGALVGAIVGAVVGDNVELISGGGGISKGPDGGGGFCVAGLEVVIGGVGRGGSSLVISDLLEEPGEGTYSTAGRIGSQPDPLVADETEDDPLPVGLDPLFVGLEWLPFVELCP